MSKKTKTYYCESFEPGFYEQTLKSKVDGRVFCKRVYYLTGDKKGNKWIDLITRDPAWNSLMWTCIRKVDMEIGDLKFHGPNNPCSFPLKL